MGRPHNGEGSVAASALAVPGLSAASQMLLPVGSSLSLPALKPVGLGGIGMLQVGYDDSDMMIPIWWNNDHNDMMII